MVVGNASVLLILSANNYWIDTIKIGPRTKPGPIDLSAWPEMELSGAGEAINEKYVLIGYQVLRRFKDALAGCFRCYTEKVSSGLFLLASLQAFSANCSVRRIGPGSFLFFIQAKNIKTIT